MVKIRKVAVENESGNLMILSFSEEVATSIERIKKIKKQQEENSKCNTKSDNGVKGII